MVDYIKFTPELANDWKSVQTSVSHHHVSAHGLYYKHCAKRVEDASTHSQLESKLWIIEEVIKLNINIDRVAILAGWYANFIVPLLIDELGVSFIHNFEIDRDVQYLSYKFNNRYKSQSGMGPGKYKCDIVDVMFDPIGKYMKMGHPNFDLIINTSCEHMFPMRNFTKLNKGFLGNPLYVLQSTDEDKYDDHINCVSGPEDLIQQSDFTEVIYSGTKELNNGMKRFMVIGR
jgi:hypothetical protein